MAGGFAGGADVVGQGGQVAVGGEDPDALDLGAVVVVLEERGLAGGEGAAGADDVWVRTTAGPGRDAVR